MNGIEEKKYVCDNEINVTQENYLYFNIKKINFNNLLNTSLVA